MKSSKRLLPTRRVVGCPTKWPCSLAAGRAPGAIGDYIWHDANWDGFQDGDESPLANITVSLKGLAGVILQPPAPMARFMNKNTAGRIIKRIQIISPVALSVDPPDPDL